MASGTITDDPLTSLPVGARLDFQCLSPMESNANAVPNFVNNWDHFDGALLGILFKSATAAEVDGSAAMIGPGLALSASHVFAPRKTAIMAGELVPYCFGIRNDSLQFWKVTAFVDSDEANDLVVLYLTACSAAPDDFVYFVFGMRSSSPQLGEQVHLVGFRSEVLEGFTGTDLNCNLYVSAGEVSEVYPTGRDRVLAPFPCFEVASGALGSMSGGAAFDAQGRLLGLVSRSFSTEDGAGPTTVALLGPALDRQIAPPWPPKAYAPGITIRSLNRKGVSILTA